MVNITFLPSMNQPKPAGIGNLNTLVDAIQTGNLAIGDSYNNNFVEASSLAFETYKAEGKSDQYNEYKSSLPLFLPGTFTYRNAEGFQDHAGIIVCDFDNVTDDARMGLYKRLVMHPFTIAVYNTPAGLRSLHHVYPQPTKAYEHSYLYDMLISSLIADGVIVEGQDDNRSREVHRGYILYHDANMFRYDDSKYNRESLEWDPVEIAERECAKAEAEAEEERQRKAKSEEQALKREERRKEIASLTTDGTGLDKKSLDQLKQITTQPSPLSAEAIDDINPIGYLETEGIIKFTGSDRGGRREFHHPGSDQQRSGTVSDDGNVLTIFSSTLLSKLPSDVTESADGTNINASRAAIWFATGKDIKGITNESADVRDAIAKEIYEHFGVGCDPDVLKKANTQLYKLQNPPAHTNGNSDAPAPATNGDMPKRQLKRSKDDPGRLLKQPTQQISREVAPAPQLPRFPREVLSKVAVFKDWMDAWDGASECPLEYIFAVLKALISAELGRQIYVAENEHIYPNCFVVLMGPAGFSRKSTAMSGVARHVAKEATPNVLITSAINSSEGLGDTFALPNGIKIGQGLPAEYLHSDEDDEDLDDISFVDAPQPEPAPKPEPQPQQIGLDIEGNRGAQPAVTEPPEPEPQQTESTDDDEAWKAPVEASPDVPEKKVLPKKGMAGKVDIYRLNEMLLETHSDEGFRVLGIIDEMASFLQKSKNQATAGILQGINTLYNMPDKIENNSISNPMTADYPCLSLMTAIPTETFQRLVGTSEAANGFASRFEYYLVEKTINKAISRPPNSAKVDRVVDVVATIRNAYYYQTGFTYTADAQERLEKYYNPTKDEILRKDPNKIGSQARFDSHLKKNALIFAALRGMNEDVDSPTKYKITLRDIEISIALSEYLISVNDYIFDVVSDTRMEAIEAKLLRLIDKGYHTAKTLSAQCRTDSEVVTRALNAMVAVGKLGTETTPRTTKYYRAADDDDLDR